MRRLNADQTHPVTLTLNGRTFTRQASPRMLLSDFLRQQLHSTQGEHSKHHTRVTLYDFAEYQGFYHHPSGKNEGI